MAEVVAVAEEVAVDEAVEDDDLVAVADAVDVRVVSVFVLVAVALEEADPVTDRVPVPVARVAVVVPDVVALALVDTEARGDAEPLLEVVADGVALTLGKRRDKQATCAPMAPK